MGRRPSPLLLRGAPEILLLVRQGASFNEACRTAGVPKATARRWRSDYPRWDEYLTTAEKREAAGVIFEARPPTQAELLAIAKDRLLRAVFSEGVPRAPIIDARPQCSALRSDGHPCTARATSLTTTLCAHHIRARCRALNAHGTQCGHVAIRGESFCYAHRVSA